MKYDELNKDELISKIEKLEHDLIKFKNTNNTLVKAEEQTRFQTSLLNAVEQAVVVTNPDGEITFWNPFAERVYGWNAKQAIGQNILDVTVPKISHKQGAEIMKNLNAGQSWSGEFEAQNRNGKNFPVFVTDTPVLNKKGELTGIIGVSIDISERKKAQEKLLEREHLLSKAESISNQGSWKWDIANDKWSFSDSWLKIHGTDHSGISRKELMKIAHPDDASKVEKAMSDALDNNLPYSLEHRIIRKDNGKVRIIKALGEVHFNKNRKPEYMIGVAQDITERKQTEAEITQNNANLNALIENTNDAIWSIDKDYKLLTANSVFLEDIKPLYNERLSIGSLLLDKEKLSPELYEEWKSNYDRALSGNNFKTEFVTNLGPDTKRFLEISYNPIINDKKEVAGVSIIGRDITERKQAEAKIQAAEENLQNTFDLSPGIIAKANLKTGYFIEANQAVSKLLGYTVEEFTSIPIMELIHPDDRYKAVDEISDQLAGKVANYHENRYLCKDGSYKWISWQGTIADKNGIVTAVGSDITDRKLAEFELVKAKELAEENEEKFRLLHENAGLGIGYISPEGNIISFNAIAANDLNGVPQDFAGKSIFDLFPKAAADTYFERMQKAINSNEIEDYEDFIELPNNKKWFLSTYTKIVDAQNKVLGVQIISQDITEIKKAESELKIAKDKAEENEEKFKLLNRLTSEMLLLSDIESIYKFISETLRKYYPNSLVVTVSIDEAIQKSKLEAVSGLENSLIKKIIKISGFNPFEKTFKLIDYHINYYKSGNFVEFKGGVAKFAGPEFPAFASKTVEKLIGVYKIYSIGINKDDELLAAVHFLTFNKQVISDGNFIEVFVKQAGLVLQKKINEKALKIAKEKAEESEKQLKLIADNFVNGMIYQVAMLDENRRQFNYISKNVEELYGCTVLEAKEDANLIYGKIHPDDINGLIEKEKEALRTMSTFETEARVFASNGNIRWAYYISKPRVINGIVCWDGIEVDFTERKQMELELRKAKEKAEESDRLKSAFLANMSHEIRTPMNGILGFTGLLQEPNLTGKKQQKYIDIIQRSGDRMLNTINDIIDISKIEAGQADVIISDINLNKQVDEMYEFFLPEAKKKNIKLSITNRVSDQQANFKSDKEKLDSILTNFVKNAIKYTHSGSIEFGYSISKQDKNNQLEFYVKDTGIGISKDRQEAVFGRFIQADIEDKQVYEGSGLGLAISKAYVEMLGGKIWVESEEGIGSKFCFTIPYETNSKKIDEKNTEESNNQLSVKKGLKVLIVEDDEFAVTYLSAVLKEYTKEMLIAKTGIEAVEMCRDNPELDIVLMDIKIPGIDGYEATRKIREFNKDVFIVAQTAYAQSGDREKSIQAGCNDYISKPIDKEKLLGIISNRF